MGIHHRGTETQRDPPVRACYDSRAVTFQDHFSGHADAYARHRPRYPGALFAWLASLVRERELAWDAGTGNGQVAIALADHFARVVATDASAEQIARAAAHERVEYRHEPSDRVSIAEHSVDLITAGAAAHWFELEGFYDEVRRVAKRGAMVALFSYGPRDFEGILGEPLRRFNEEILAGFWPERMELVHQRYRTLPFPFAEIEAPPFTMTAKPNLGELLAFLETWSASQRYLERHGTRATDAIKDEVASVWGDPNERRAIAYPLFMRAGRVIDVA